VSVLAVVNPVSRAVEYYRSICLPFGAVASVYAFNRVARAIKRLGQSLLFLAVTNYFDDFPHLEAEVGALDSRQAFAHSQ
jgi:hypothetical protein